MHAFWELLVVISELAECYDVTLCHEFGMLSYLRNDFIAFLNVIRVNIINSCEGEPTNYELLADHLVRQTWSLFDLEMHRDSVELLP